MDGLNRYRFMSDTESLVGGEGAEPESGPRPGRAHRRPVVKCGRPRERGSSLESP
jgi:hypothetical protein